MALAVLISLQAASVVPTLVDPKRRVRRASQECVALLASFMGPPSRSGPLLRSVELLESHFEKGQGVLEAVQVRDREFITYEETFHIFATFVLSKGPPGKKAAPPPFPGRPCGIQCSGEFSTLSSALRFSLISFFYVLFAISDPVFRPPRQQRQQQQQRRLG